MNTNTKARVYVFLEDLQLLWDTQYEAHFEQEKRNSIIAQLIKNKRMLDDAKNEADITVVETRIHKLADWLRHTVEEVQTR